MSLTSEGMSAADIAAITRGNGDGFGDWGGSGAWWLIILFLFMFNGNWGNGFGGGYGGGTGYVGSEVQRGFDQNAIMSGLGGIQSSVTNGFFDTGAALCNGFAGVNANVAGGFAGVNGAIANGFAQAEIANNSRQMADMNQQFALQSSLQNCCCENRAATADLKYTIATENCADRTALAEGVRDILESQSAGIQRILDQMCNDKIDAKNERIADLERQLTMANLAASQGAQTAAILANNDAQTNALEQYLAPVPRPAYIVQNPNGCNCGTTCASCGF
jgi:hypothetical protein